MKGPDCERTQRFLDGRLDEAERAACEGHLAGCPDCTALVASWRQFSRAFRAQTTPLLAPPSEADQRRLAQKLRAESPGHSPWRWSLALVAAAVLLGVFGWWRGRLAPESVPIATLEGVALSTSGQLDAPAAGQALVTIGADRVGLAPSSRVQVKRHDRQQVQLSLVAGAVSAAVQPRAAGQSFVVTVESLAVTVVGTRFRVERLPDGARVDVIEGHVRVSTASQGWDVVRGQRLEVHGGAARTSAFTATEFPELLSSRDVPAHPLEPPADAGQADPPDAGPAAPPVAPSVGAATLRAWRRDALEGRCLEVLPTLRRACREHPQQADVWAVAADCARLTGNDREAATAYQRVVAVAGTEDADHARMLLASVLLERLGDARGAADVLTAFLKHPQPPALEAAARVKLARAYLATGKKALARSELKRVVTTLADAPSAPEALDLLQKLRDP